MTSSSPPSSVIVSNPNRWKALTILSLAQFLIILDTSIIGVALPTIQEHFGITQTDLQWIFNAYVITFGALLLLGGKLSDILGQRNVFTTGFLILTAASVLAGISMSNDMLITARVLQGVGAAMIAPSALSIVMNLFSTNKSEMNKAMGIWGAAAPAGGTAGVFLGGITTAWFDWPWVFLINVPIGIAVLALIPKLIPKGNKKKGSIDYRGALTITASLGLLIYSIVTASENGWTSLQTTILLSISIAMFVGFIVIEKRSKEPLIPLHIFKIPNLLSSNIVMALLGASWVSMWFFLNLYLQQILHYGPLESGLALLPMTGLIMIMMTWLMPRLIGKLGVKENLIVGLGLLTIGLILFSFTPANSDQGNNNHIFLVYVLPASIISALGMSFSYIPILVSAISNARNEESGVASGLVNTTYQIGSAVGLAIMVSLSTSHSNLLIDIGMNISEALNQGFHLAFIGAAIISAIASVTAVSFIKMRSKE
ncbi:MAG TPA: MFS transporter [Candidatus Saccharimonadales bacterium]|nr:MFS transporter [Candidatus Saccharimonadales bacterium]